MAWIDLAKFLNDPQGELDRALGGSVVRVVMRQNKYGRQGVSITKISTAAIDDDDNGFMSEHEEIVVVDDSPARFYEVRANR